MKTFLHAIAGDNGCPALPCIGGKTMSPYRSGRSTSKVAWIVVSFAFGVSEIAGAAAGDCTQIDSKAAATILGVQTTRADATNPVHRKLPPDNMDLLACGYAEATVDPSARTFSYFIYTPIPKDLVSVYTAMANGNFPRKQVFSPNVGDQSSGWFRASARDDTFEGYIIMQTGPTIVEIKVGGVPSSDAVKNALVSAAKILAKP